MYHCLQTALEKKYSRSAKNLNDDVEGLTY